MGVRVIRRPQYTTDPFEVHIEGDEVVIIFTLKGRRLTEIARMYEPGADRMTPANYQRATRIACGILWDERRKREARKNLPSLLCQS